MNNRKVLIPIGIIVFLVVGYLILDSVLFTGVKPKSIHEKGFQATYFAKKNLVNRPAVILLGGGQWGDYWAQYFGQNNLIGLSLPYTGRPGLPDLPEEIALEYFAEAISWLARQPEVDPNKIVVMGASKHAELALVLASTLHESVHGVVAYAPSSVSWSNTVLPYNSNELKPSWTYQGKDIPYIPMDKIKGNASNTLDMLGYWESGLAKSEFVEQAMIPVEKINGPIVLFSGKDDQIWPSVKMADMIEKRLVENGFKHTLQNLQYDAAGHAISSNPDDPSSYPILTMQIDGKEYEYSQGGTAEGDFQAKQDARGKLMEFLGNL